MKIRHLTNLCSRIIFLCALLCGGYVYSQTVSSPFTVLSNNADIQNKKLYVEIMYEKATTCGDYKAQFRLTSRNNTAGEVIAVDSFLNNPGTYETELSGVNKHKSLSRPTAGGYRLRFTLPNDAKVDSNYQICVDAYKMAYRCENCGAGGSSPIFGPSDIDTSCPYSGGDVIACYQRESRAGNWEAWIQDPRDNCKPYRIVLMRDGKWWFAQNLNFTNNLIYSEANPDATTTGLYWCPTGASITQNKTVAMIGADIDNQTTTAPASPSQTCKTYGALYTWATTVASQGRSNLANTSTPTPVGQTSNTQGICPDGWLVPSDYDWGAVLNAADTCTNFTTQKSSAPCNHYRNDLTMGYFGTQTEVQNLKASHSCPPSIQKVDSACATNSSPSWSWRRANYKSALSTAFAIGQDYFGFTTLPSGYRVGGSNVYKELGKRATFTSSTESNSSNLIARVISTDSTVRRVAMAKSSALSVRCMSALPVIYLENSAYTFETGLILSVGRVADPSQYTYTWSVAPDNGKITFPTNGSVSAQRVTAKTSFSSADAGTSYTINVIVKSSITGVESSTRLNITVATYTPTITAFDSAYVQELALPLSVNPAVSTMGAAYTYTWSVTPNNGKFTFPNNAMGNASTMLASANNLTPSDVGNYTFTVAVKSTTGAEITTSKVIKYSSIPAILCANCGFNGSTWGDMYVSSRDNATSVYFSNTTPPAMNHPRDGNSNTAAIAATSGAIKTCRDMGRGWYLPSYAEYLRIMASMINADGNTLSDTYNFGNNNDTYWTSTVGVSTTSIVYYHNPMLLRSSTATHYLLYYSSYNAANRKVRCVWKQ